MPPLTSLSPSSLPISFDTSKYPYSHHPRLTQLSLKLTHLFASQRAQEQLQLSRYVAQLNGETTDSHITGAAAYVARNDDDTESLFDEQKYSSYERVRAPHNTMEIPHENRSNRAHNNTDMFPSTPQRPMSATPKPPFLSPITNVEHTTATHRPLSPHTPLPPAMPAALPSSLPSPSISAKPAHTELLLQWQAEEKAHDERSAYQWSQQQTLNAIYNDSLRQLIEQHRTTKQTLFNQKQQRIQHEQQTTDVSNHQVETIIAATSMSSSLLSEQPVSDADRIRLQYAEMHIAEQEWHNQLLSEQTAAEKQRISAAESWQQRLDEELGIAVAPLTNATEIAATFTESVTISAQQHQIVVTTTTPPVAAPVDHVKTTSSVTSNGAAPAITTMTLAPTNNVRAVEKYAELPNPLSTTSAVEVQPPTNTTLSLSPLPTPALSTQPLTAITSNTVIITPPSTVHSQSKQQTETVIAENENIQEQTRLDTTLNKSAPMITVIPTVNENVLSSSTFAPRAVASVNGAVSKSLANNTVIDSQTVVSSPSNDNNSANHNDEDDDDDEYDDPLNFLRSRRPQSKPLPKQTSSVPSSRPATSSASKPLLLTQNHDIQDESPSSTAINPLQVTRSPNRTAKNDDEDDDDDDEFGGEWTVSNKPVNKALLSSSAQTLIASVPKNNNNNNVPLKSSSSLSSYQLNPKLSSSASSSSSGRSKRLIFST